MAKAKDLTSEAKARALLHWLENKSCLIHECNIFIHKAYAVCLSGTKHGVHVSHDNTVHWNMGRYNSSKYQLWLIRYESFDSIQIISILAVKNKIQLHLFHYNFHYTYTLLQSDMIT